MEDLTTVDEAALELMEEEEELDVAKLAEESQEAPVVRLVNIMLTDAIKRGASDIHVEPYEKSFRVRYRIDGLLREVMNPPQRLQDAITSRIKVLAKTGHRREAAAPGRPHQAQGQDRGADARTRLPRLGAARRCTARRSCCGCSTRRTCAWT